MKTDGARPEKHILLVCDADGSELIRYQPERHVEREPPKPATELPPPPEIASVEELYLTGLHLEQYRHATRSPETYWLEGLEREPDDARLNHAMGLSFLRKGEFAKAEGHFARALRRLTMRNPNPQDGAPHYHLGLAQIFQGKIQEAYASFYKSTWNYAWQSAGNYALASISAQREEFVLALEQVETSLRANSENLKARALKAALLRRLGHGADARVEIEATLALDMLDFRMRTERFLLTQDEDDLAALVTGLEGDLQTLLDVAFDLAWSGLRDDASLLLESCAKAGRWDHPMLWYTLAWLAAAPAKLGKAVEYAARAEAASGKYCFPARIEEMIVLESAIARNPSSARAHAYLGNLYYDKRRYDDAIRCWRRSVDLDGTYSVPWRNLGIAEFNVLHNPQAADRMYEQAFAANSEDARLLYEWDQLKKRAVLASPEERLHMLEQHLDLVWRRDDLTVERGTLLNQLGRFTEALELLSERRFSPWEGGEGLTSSQYVYAHRALGLAALESGNAAEALGHFEMARVYPRNLGEGKHLLTLERDLDYFSGVAAQQTGALEKARGYWTVAASPLVEPGPHTYFQALALRALGDEEASCAALKRLGRFAEERAQETPKIDYFATSLPNLLLFDDDLEKRNRIESTVLAALANHGLGASEKAVELLRQATAEDPNYLLALDALRWVTRAAELEPDARPAS